MASINWILLLGLLMFVGWTWGRPWRRRRWLASRPALEDTLKVCYQALQDGHAITLDTLAGALHVTPHEVVPLLQRLEQERVVTREADAITLTPEGMRMAVSVVRAHRLLERYLADETGLAASEVHTVAHRQEHQCTPEDINRLDAYLGYPRADPHGDPIPTEDGTLPVAPATPLLVWPVNTPAQLVHLEDEPEALYAQLVAEGLRPGLPIRILARTSEQVILIADDREIVLAPVAAAQMHVQAAQPRAVPTGVRLSEIARGRPGIPHVVLAIDPACQGITRRRLLDLGLTPGASVEVAMISAFGDPIAYRIRDALLALRREQAEQIWVAIREVSA